MGRTKRKRIKKQNEENLPERDWSDIIELQRSLQIKCPSLRIDVFENTGRGIKCCKKLDRGDAIIALPLDIIITPHSQSNVFKLLKNVRRQPQLDLSLFLIYESHLGQQSKYFKYLATLPKTYTNLFFSTLNEIKLLPKFIQKLVVVQGENIKNVVENLFSNIKGAICTHCQLQLSEIFSIEKLHWAWFTVNTRSVYYEDKNEKKKSLALAPFLDLLNHSSQADTEMIIDHEKRQYILKTKVEFKKFSQVFIKYGPHSNLNLAIEYGFVVPNNPYDSIEFSLDEILAASKEINSNYGNMTKCKYNFIIANKLNENLTKGIDECSWNLNALIYVLISWEESISCIRAKVFSNEFTNSDSIEMDKIRKRVFENKSNELSAAINVMNEVENCTKSFQIAKELITMYINLLQN